MTFLQNRDMIVRKYVNIVNLRDSTINSHSLNKEREVNVCWFLFFNNVKSQIFKNSTTHTHCVCVCS